MSEQTRGNVITLRGRVAEPLRPPRLTFARRCIWCGELDCQHPDCVALHEVSVWAVCRLCDGTGLAFSGPQGCTCAFGLIHVAPAVHRVLGVTGKGEVVTEQGHWSSYNDRTYYEFFHPAELSKRVSPVEPLESGPAKRVTAVVPLDAGTGEAVAL
ncbi:hypothetical protein ABZ894_30470 [Nocardia beijingensis]|uniref:hypothetical protein n=1 Tax=Nocardia beijingensis TaxID=95162 RepID=UPI0033E1F3DB